MREEKLGKLVDKRIPGLFSILVTFAAIEFGILLVCLAFSPSRDIVKIYNADKQVIYENDYNLTHIKEFKRAYGIKKLKENGFVLTRLKKENQFPIRAWIALSICIPLIVILFTAFIIKVFEDMFPSSKRTQGLKKQEGKGKEKDEEQEDTPSPDFEESKFEKLFSTLGRLNVYSLGTTILVIAFLYWMVPDLLVFVGKISYQTISELKWVILGIILLVGLYLIIRSILAHKTRTEIIRQQADIQKNRDRLAIEAKLEMQLLGNNTNFSEKKSK